MAFLEVSEHEFWKKFEKFTNFYVKLRLFDHFSLSATNVWERRAPPNIFWAPLQSLSAPKWRRSATSGSTVFRFLFWSDLFLFILHWQWQSYFQTWNWHFMGNCLALFNRLFWNLLITHNFHHLKFVKKAPKTIKTWIQSKINMTIDHFNFSVRSSVWYLCQ